MKNLLVEVKPNCKNLKLEMITDSVYKLHLTAPAKDGKANKQLIEVLADHFKVAKSLITIKSGQSSRNKHVIIS
jgi:uncharacterized protein